MEVGPPLAWRNFSQAMFILTARQTFPMPSFFFLNKRKLESYTNDSKFSPSVVLVSHDY